MPWGLTRFHHGGQSHRHSLLLPSPHSTPSLRSVAQGRLRLFTTDASRRIFEPASECVRRGEDFGQTGRTQVLIAKTR
jgi:hypothetical protein